MTVQKEWFEQDYYDILDVSPTATPKEITKAYRVLAKKYHPDANSSDKEAEEKFKEVTNAYEVVGDEENRKEYDQIRMMGPSGFGGNGMPPGYGFPFAAGMNYTESSSDDNDDLSTLLTGLFSRVRKPNAQQHNPEAHHPDGIRNNDVEAQVALSFYQALEGAVLPVSYSLPGDKSPREVKVKIPAGVNDGQRIKVKGHGATTAIGQRGDLYVVVSVATHPWFGRKGRTLSVTVPLSYAESVAGAQVRVPTLGQPVTVKVPAMTKTDTTLRVKGRGCDIAGEKGDLLVTFDVVAPNSISSKESELFTKLVGIQVENPRAKFGLEK